MTRLAASPVNPFAGKRYAHPRFKGVALRVAGYTQRWDLYNVDDDLEGEWVDDTDGGRVRVVMIGDDKVHEVDLSELTEIDEESFCPSCGQLGCGWH